MRLGRLLLAVALLLAVILLAAASPVKAQQQTHTVQPGQTLSGIARIYGVTTEQLAAANGIVNPNLIYVGQVLVIPGSAPAPEPQPNPGTGGTYTVQPGDTLSAIAARFNTTVSTLVSLNGLTNPNLLFVGQVLVLPGGQPTPQPPVTSQPPATTQPPPQDVTYTVQPGDSLSRIALRFGTTWQELALLNNLSNPNFLYVGQVLIIQRATAPEPTQEPTRRPTATPTRQPTATPTATKRPTATPTRDPNAILTPTPIVKP